MPYHDPTASYHRGIVSQIAQRHVSCSSKVPGKTISLDTNASPFNNPKTKPRVPKASHKIEIADQQSLEFDAAPLISAVQAIADDHHVKIAEISIAVVDDPTIRVLNRQYLNHDYETDVISFVLDWNEECSRLLGQLIVSTDTATTLAAEIGGTMQDELLLYVVHGMLHLVGYDDKQPALAAKMREAEKVYLNRQGVEHRGFEQRPHQQTGQNGDSV